MSVDQMLVYSKIAALLMFAPMFLGIALWVYWPSNKAKIESLAYLPLQDD